jgi:hypothetical protein
MCFSTNLSLYQFTDTIWQKTVHIKKLLWFSGLDIVFMAKGKFFKSSLWTLKSCNLFKCDCRGDFFPMSAWAIMFWHAIKSAFFYLLLTEDHSVGETNGEIETSRHGQRESESERVRARERERERWLVQEIPICLFAKSRHNISFRILVRPVCEKIVIINVLDWPPGWPDGANFRPLGWLFTLGRFYILQK